MVRGAPCGVRGAGCGCAGVRGAAVGLAVLVAGHTEEKGGGGQSNGRVWSVDGGSGRGRGGEGSGAHEPERERRGILSTLSDVSLCEALLLPTDLLLAGGGAINPSVACDVLARWLLVLPWIWMVEDPLCGC